MTAEIFGRETGLSSGKGGHMHLFDPEVNFACSGIIAEGCPPAAGAGLAAKKREEDSVAVAYLGEGAISQGAFLETLNFVSVHNLPVVFVIEDNEWAISMPKERITAPLDGSQRGDGFDIFGVRVEHDDAIEIYEEAQKAVGRARDGNGPTILEVQVHRRMGHFMGDPQTYRPESDQELHQKRDSIERMRADIETRDVEEARIESLQADAEERVDDAIAWAKDQPAPDPADAHEDMFVNPPAGVTETEPDFDIAGGDD
jgi:pyruvate dehydrogenase E1 component alpha subunit